MNRHVPNLPVLRLGWLVLACVLGLTTTAYAQASITGVVRDTSGAVLPGVTVEASSPALIERVRVAVSDGSGQYRIENLRPGAYTVTFTLPGFSVMRREGIQLSGTAVVTVPAEMVVGALEETVTVTGETPTVDVQTTIQQRVLDRAVLEILPSGRGASRLASLAPSVTPDNHDVGGVMGDGSSRGGIRSRGVQDSRLLMAGVSIQTGTGTTHGLYNLEAYEEILVDTGAVNADYYTGGVRINFIPRDGGNTFSGSFMGSFANDSMSSDNLSQARRDQGLTSTKVKQLADVNPAFGGPIRRDRLWFHAAALYSRAWNFAPVFLNKHAGNPDVWIYEPDLAQEPATTRNMIKNINTRLTWQASPRNKLALTYDLTRLCDCPRSLSASSAPESNIGSYVSQPRENASLEWTAPLTSRVLLEANVVRVYQDVARARVNPYFAPSPIPLVEVQEQSTNLRYRGTSVANRAIDIPLQTRTVMSYITGAHSIRVGTNAGRWSQQREFFSPDAPLSYRFSNGVPNRITLQDTPYWNVVLGHEFALFAQDKWTVKRLTVDAGFRYDYMKLIFPEQTVGPGAFSPNRNIVFPETSPLRWHDMQPRTGLALDLFGNGKTALKASLNRYLAGAGSGGLFGIGMAPGNQLVTVANRSWDDANRNYVPDCDLRNPARNGECGALDNSNFASTRPATEFDPAVLEGWHQREFNWQFSSGVQHEILPRTSVTLEYWRTWFGNQVVTQHRALGPGDFDEFSITAPVDSRLPGGGGYVVSGLYDIKPGVFGRPPDGLVTVARNFGKQVNHWNGVDFTINARPRAGVLLQGGTTTQRQSTDNCEVVRLAGAPPSQRGGGLGAYNPSQWHCQVEGKFLTQLKLLGAVTVPRIDMQVSASLQSLPGPEIGAAYTASNAEVAPSLGRSLAGSARNVTVALIEPRSMYGDRINQLDLRVGKILQLGRTRATVSLDVYNVFNSDAVLDLNPTFGPNWLQPEQILNARFAKIVVHLRY